MKYRLTDKHLIVETENNLKVPFFGRKRNGRYKVNWHFISDFLEWFELELTEEAREQLKKNVARRKAIMDVFSKEEVEDYTDYFSGDLKPYDFQAQAIEFISENNTVLLADDVGLGKTVCTIGAILDLIWKAEADKFLIVVPANLRLQWRNELRKFISRDSFPDLRLVIQTGTKKERKRLYRDFASVEYGIMVVSYAGVRNDIDYLQGIDFDMIALDEATKIKNRTTKTNKIIRKVYGDIDRKLALTATPIENGLEDLYCICEWLDKARLRTKTYFKHRYCIVERQKIWRGRGNVIMVDKISGYKNIKDAKIKLHGLYARRTFGLVQEELPGIVTRNVTGHMKKKQRNVYSEVKGDIYGENTTIDKLAQLTLLQEVCNNTALIDDTVESGWKGDMIKELLDDELHYQKIIMITRFKKYAYLLMDKLEDYNIELICGDTKQSKRNLIIEDFTAGDGQKIILGTTAIEEGLNLQAGSILINIDLPWNPAKLSQRLGRIRRLGSEHGTVRMINFYTKDSLEERVYDVMYEKGQLFESMFDREEQAKIKNLIGEREKVVITEL